MSPTPIRSQRAFSSSPVYTTTLSLAPRQLSSPFPSAGDDNSAAEQPAAQPTMDLAAQARPQLRNASFAEPATVHQYNLMHGTDYVTIEIASRAPSAEDHPLLYPDDELRGVVVLSKGGLRGMQRIDVVVSWGPSRQCDRN
jgi:hypothetical protein